MTWTRLRTWIGEHPEWPVALSSIPYLAAVGAWSGGTFTSFAPYGDWIRALVAGIAFASLCLVGGSGLWVGCFLGRAGLGARPALRSALWMWLGAVVAHLGMLFVIWSRTGWTPRDPWEREVPLALSICLSWATIASIPAIVAALLGLMTGAWIAGRLIRHGQWETTVPVSPPQPPPDASSAPPPPPEAKP